MERNELYYRVAQSHLLDQDERNRQLEFKASGVIGLAVALAGVAVVVIKDFSQSPDSPSVGAVTVAAAFVITFVFSVALAVRASRVYTWRRDPDLRSFAQHLSDDYDDSKLVEWVGDQFANSVEHNENLIERKADTMNKAIVALMIQVALLAALVMVVSV